jgi:hypothetical protein
LKREGAGIIRVILPIHVLTISGLTFCYESEVFQTVLKYEYNIKELY